jgi:hypothetical protein
MQPMNDLRVIRVEKQSMIISINRNGKDNYDSNMILAHLDYCITIICRYAIAHAVLGLASKGFGERESWARQS